MPTDLKGQLGHSDLSTTQIYAALVDSRRRDSVFALSLVKRPQKAEEPQKGDQQGDQKPGDGPGQVKEPAA